MDREGNPGGGGGRSGKGSSGDGAGELSGPTVLYVKKQSGTRFRLSKFCTVGRQLFWKNLSNDALFLFLV